jgi:hypothetical protein
VNGRIKRKKKAQKFEEKVEESMHIGADGLQVTDCFVGCKGTR